MSFLPPFYFTFIQSIFVNPPETPSCLMCLDAFFSPFPASHSAHARSSRNITSILSAQILASNFTLKACTLPLSPTHHLQRKTVTWKACPPLSRLRQLHTFLPYRTHMGHTLWFLPTPQPQCLACFVRKGRQSFHEKHQRSS